MALFILNPGARRGGRLASHPGALPTGKNLSTYCTGDWVGPRISPDGFGGGKNLLFPLGFELPTSQPVVSSSADPCPEFRPF